VGTDPRGGRRYCTDEQAKQIQNVLQPNQEKVVAEKNKTIAKLDDGISGTCFISTKAKLPNNIQAMDQET